MIRQAEAGKVSAPPSDVPFPVGSRVAHGQWGEGVVQRLGASIDADDLLAQGFDEIVLATGIRPRRVDFPGADHPKVCSYVDVLSGKVTVGASAALIGAGGIGFDTFGNMFKRVGAATIFGYGCVIVISLAILVDLDVFNDSAMLDCIPDNGLIFL